MRAWRARQASVSGRGAHGARGRAGEWALGRGRTRRRQARRGARNAGGQAAAARQAQVLARGALGVSVRSARRGRARRAAWARAACGVGMPVRAGWACWLVNWASFGAQCTWLSFDSVFGPVRLGIFLSHLRNTVHCKINFRKKNIY